MNQAKVLGIPLYDCIVTFDLRACPPTIRVQGYKEKFKPETVEGFNETRSKENITCLFYSNIIVKELDDSGDGPLLEVLFMWSLFPHEWLTKHNKEEGTGNNASHSLFGKIASSFMALRSAVDYS